MALSPLTQLSQLAPPAATLSVTQPGEGAATIVTLRGEADVFTLPIVVDALARVTSEHDGPVVVDLAGTTFIDAGTVGAFACASQALGSCGRELTLRSPSPLAVRVLTILALSHLVEGTTSDTEHVVSADRKKEAPCASS